jgi:hypothetical protein
MIIKPADDKSSQLAELEALATRSDCTPEQGKRIVQEIRNIKAGMRGEAEAAYEIEFHFGASKNKAIIHDLRLECEGRVAQIDHLIINRLMNVWVCESKHFSEGLSVNEHGECTAFFAGKPYGVPSPIEQNKKHIAVLESVFKSGTVALPTRLGFTIKPQMYSLVMVSKKARITRPQAKIEGLDDLIKNDAFKSRLDQHVDDDNNPLNLAKLIGSDTLEQFARALAAAHKPVKFNWAAKFGFSESAPAPKPLANVAASTKGTPVVNDVLSVAVEPVEAAADEKVETASDALEQPKKKMVCHACASAVPYQVARFCWFNKPRFGGNVYCINCQSNITTPPAT